MMNPYRLLRTVIPSAYRLRFDVDLDAAAFAGSAEIDVAFTEPVREFSLNAAELVLSTISVRVGEREFLSDSPVMNDDYETATFKFHEDLPTGQATLSLNFNGILNGHLRGFYRSTYSDSEHVEHVIATTQFESTDARRAFPCWDEPAFKATYEVTLEVPEGLAAFSNTKEVSNTTLESGRSEIRFAQTMIMSTYLVAFIVGPFEASPATMVAGTPVRIVYPKGKGHLVAWAMELAVHALEYFAEYFAIPYPGDKLDLVAIPDFAAGAMENLGCVTFRETELLIDVSTASHAEMEQVALVVNHELAHMWFGDLVTMDWWEGIWLNEAFATFMEMLCSDHFRPEWKKWVSFNPTRDMAFSVDGQHSTRSIEYEVVSPNDCRGMFDILTYIKGSAVLRMLEQYLGATTFRDGIRIYLQRHAYANTITADLWAALEAGSGQQVGEIMDTWILQGGYPLVSVKGSTLTQRPFEYSEATGSSNIGHDWKVPVMTRSLDGGLVSAQLLEETPLVIENAGVVVVNAGGSGFYRTAYDSESLAAIAARLEELDEIERAVLFSDTWASILVGQSSFVDLFVLAKGLIELDEPATWNVVARAFDMASRLLGESDRDALATVVQSLCAPVLKRLGWDPVKGETTQAGELRAIVIAALGTYAHDAAVVAEALARFDAEKVRGDLADAIVAITMQQDRPGDPQTCEERRAAATNPQDEQRYLFAPANSSNPAVVLDAFERAFTTVRTQDAPYLVGTLMRNRGAGPQVWRLMTQRWDEADELFPDGSNVAMVAGVLTFGAHGDLAIEVRNFHESNPVKAGQQQVEQFLDLMDLYVALATRNRESLGDALRSFAN
jgi:puromycin-sensitive aminopeptidase